MVDAVRHLAQHVGPADLVVSTWTCAEADVKLLDMARDSGWLRSVMWMFDRSFLQREPEIYNMIIRNFGIENFRCWVSHCKFAILYNCDCPCLYVTSANLNANFRVEHWSLFCNAALVEEYHGLVLDLFDTQRVGVTIADGFAGVTNDTRRVLGQVSDHKASVEDWSDAALDAEFAALDGEEFPEVDLEGLEAAL